MNILSQIRLPAKRENLENFQNKYYSMQKNRESNRNYLLIRINLSLEEILVNIYDYSYRDDEGDSEIIRQTHALFFEDIVDAAF